jgi:Protein of unknown function (DUF2917)
MTSKVDMMETKIPKGRTVRIQDGMGLDLMVVAGSLWVTYEDDINDFVLRPGEVFHVSRDGLTLIHAFREARVRIAYPAEAAVPSLTFGGGYREVGASVMRSIVADWLRGIRGKFVPEAAGNTGAKAAQA